MAIASLGSRPVDFGNPSDIVFDAVDGDRNEGYLVFMNADPVELVITGGYLNVFARYTTTQGVFESPLLFKFFANGFQVMFTVGIPNGRYGRTVGLQVVARPQEFYRGRASSQLWTVEAGYEDNRELNPNAVNQP